MKIRTVLTLVVETDADVYANAYGETTVPVKVADHVQEIVVDRAREAFERCAAEGSELVESVVRVETTEV